MDKRKKQKKKTEAPAPARPKEFLDLIAPAAVKFNTDHYILGGTYRAVMALRTYPPATEELARLRRLGEMEGVTRRHGPSQRQRKMPSSTRLPTRAGWSRAM